ncbi:MAG TPA: zinc/iron permease, partial [Chloroflexota bacterium]|nr:zinc/iron permease [Chloroflexota bacterium]
MDNYLLALLLALLPALGTVVGAVLAEAFTISKRTLSLALHGAAGVAIAVVAVELMPQALAADPPWAIILAFVAGGGFYVVMD